MRCSIVVRWQWEGTNCGSEAKIEIKIGQIAFSGQGEQDWVAKQLDKIPAQAEKLIQLAPPAGHDEQGDNRHKPLGKDPSIGTKTLASFLKEKNATRKQVTKFLATAVWVHAKGQNRLETKDVTEALSNANQTRLGNPADCLNQNVTKGHCEKDGKQFFVTDDGKNSL